MIDSLLFNISDREDLVEAILRETNHPSYHEVCHIIVGKVRKQKFSDGELCVDYIDSVRGKRVFILSSFNNSDEIIKLNLAIDAAKRAGAVEIIPILPYFIYARGDKKDQARGPIAGKVMAEMIEQRGATSIIAFDLHADQIQGFFNIPVIHIQGKNVFDEYIYDIYDKNIILCSPDAGGGKRVKRMKDNFEKKYGPYLNYVMLDKTRKEANVVDEMVIIGDVNGKDVIIIDDMIDTFGTADKAVEILLENGANSVSMIASHGILSGPAIDRINKSKIKELVISDSLYCEPNDKIKIVSVGKQIGIAMKSLTSSMSYEALNMGKDEM